MKKTKQSLSLAIAVYNEEHNLKSCLDSVSDILDEIVVVDGGSTDATVSLAKLYTKNIIITANPPIFHINKQLALDACTKDWILQLDADEILPEDLKNEIISVISDLESNDAYYIARKNYFFGRWMKKGGMYPDYVIRLFKNKHGYFPCKSVHEQIEIQGSIGHLKSPMIHNPYPHFSDYLRKAEVYTSLTAQEYKKQAISRDMIQGVRFFIYKPLRTFASLFIRHRGYEDGFPGLVWAFFSAAHHAQAYYKYLKSQ